MTTVHYNSRYKIVMLNDKKYLTVKSCTEATYKTVKTYKNMHTRQLNNKNLNRLTALYLGQPR